MTAPGGDHPQPGLAPSVAAGAALSTNPSEQMAWLYTSHTPQQAGHRFTCWSRHCAGVSRDYPVLRAPGACLHPFSRPLQTPNVACCRLGLTILDAPSRLCCSPANGPARGRMCRVILVCGSAERTEDWGMLLPVSHVLPQGTRSYLRQSSRGPRPPSCVT